MDIRLVRELISLMDANGLAELEVLEEGMVIRLRKVENRKEIHQEVGQPKAYQTQASLTDRSLHVLYNP